VFLSLPDKQVVFVKVLGFCGPFFPRIALAWQRAQHLPKIFYFFVALRKQGTIIW
jgi:hypothetical protein